MIEVGLQPAGPRAAARSLVAACHGGSVRGAEQITSGLGALSVLSLLAYPLPIAWGGVGGLGLLAVLRWRAKGKPFASSPFVLPFGLYLAGALIGLFVGVRPYYGEIRLFGLLAALGAFFLILDQATSARAARRIVAGAAIALGVTVPIVFLLVAPERGTSGLPWPISELLAPTMPWSSGVRDRLLALDGESLAQRYRLYAAGLGALAACGVGLSFGPLLSGADRSTRLRGLLGVGYFGLFAVLAGERAVLLTAVLLAFLLGGLRYRWLLVAALLLLLAALGAITGLLRLVASQSAGGMLGLLADRVTDPGTFHARVEMWQNALFLMRDFRFTGVGLGVSSLERI